MGGREVGGLSNLLSAHRDLANRFGDAGLLSLLDNSDEPLVLLLQVDMSISQQCIQGHILFLLSVPSMRNLIACLNAYLAEQGLA